MNGFSREKFIKMVKKKFIFICYIIWILGTIEDYWHHKSGQGLHLLEFLHHRWLYFPKKTYTYNISDQINHFSYFIDFQVNLGTFLVQLGISDVTIKIKGWIFWHHCRPFCPKEYTHIPRFRWNQSLHLVFMCRRIFGYFG